MADTGGLGHKTIGVVASPTPPPRTHRRPTHSSAALSVAVATKGSRAPQRRHLDPLEGPRRVPASKARVLSSQRPDRETVTILPPIFPNDRT